MPKPLCSSCGLCSIKKWPSSESLQSCVFITGWLGGHETALFGRERDPLDPEESRFGITSSRFVARLRAALPGAQWSGIITRLAEKALNSKLVEGVVTLHRHEEDFFHPIPVLAGSEKDILKTKGSIPVLSPVLRSLEEAHTKGLKRLLVIGAACHIHALRDFHRRFDYLRNMEIYTIGIPCVDNANEKKWPWILERISKSPATARHIEFMPDYRVHVKHLDGHVEKIPFFSLPEELTNPEIFPHSCLSCFDYLNGLADITVGYLAAPFKKRDKLQWVLVRTEKGAVLNNLIADELETFPESGAWECFKFVAASAKSSAESMKCQKKKFSSTRKIPVAAGHLISEILFRTGPRGIGFAHFSVDHHLIKHYYFVKFNYPQHLERLVPRHVYSILEEYGLEA
ncbi:Coenzyme F420 hydrogenase/dehydrogenase, beta subunit C-terminal domain [Chlorobium sp. KB01]|uniref:Coenzyme F420 hydrogenase/dehydrogenase, beta subunit C-terminal domain n=1 Tax=Chlorobium sp. KB01 TaxID=1917528 RepID=UPI000977C64D|nr:Coenzyme F420 hydrogenase/dehydrogenase, beta subunit C-terminal domain [Chlorobium sp. KB01]